MEGQGISIHFQVLRVERRTGWPGRQQGGGEKGFDILSPEAEGVPFLDPKTTYCWRQREYDDLTGSKMFELLVTHGVTS